MNAPVRFKKEALSAGMLVVIIILYSGTNMLTNHSEGVQKVIYHFSIWWILLSI